MSDMFMGHLPRAAHKLCLYDNAQPWVPFTE
jgi:hypothetical protein